MRKFVVTVNGTSYEVEVEEVGADTAAVSAPAPAAKPAAPKAAPVAPKAAPKAAAGDGDPIKAPMPGNILAVKAKVGDKVKAGDAVVILEAMKMENPIPAPKDGTITSILVDKGATVESGAVLATIA